jgi:predicted outer membrane protein
MSKLQQIEKGVRFGLSVLAVGALLSACGDDSSDTDTNAQSEADASVGTYAGRGGSGSTATAGRSGNGGASATAGRSGSAGGSVSGGTGGSGVSGGSGGTGTAAGTGGTNANGGRGGAVAAGTGGAGGQAAGGTGGSTAANAQLTDAQIAAVTSTANTGEIDMGMIALTRAIAPDVRDFAQMMVTMHGLAQQRAMAVLQTINITPAANPVSDQLKSDADAMTARLQSADAAQFDLIYISGQVDVHTKVLMLIDQQLPNIVAPALRADVTTTRGEVVMHLALATTIRDRIEALSDDAGVSP